MPRSLVEACKLTFKGKPKARLVDDDDCRVAANSCAARVNAFVAGAKATSPEALIAELIGLLLSDDDGEQFWGDDFVFSGFAGTLFDFARVLEQARTSAAKPHRCRSLEIDEDEVRFFAGDLTVSGGCRVAGTLVVLGDLKVTGALQSRGANWWSGIVIVLGEASVGRMVALGPGVIGGALRSRDGIYAEYFHDSPSVMATAKLETPILVERGEHLGVRSERRKVGHAIDLTEGGDEVLHSALPERFAERGHRLFKLEEVDRALLQAISKAMRASKVAAPNRKRS